VSDSVNELSVAWSRSAEKAFLSTLEKIELEDIGTANLVLKRVDKAISLLSIQREFRYEVQLI
jgi:hypothetical protein